MSLKKLLLRSEEHRAGARQRVYSLLGRPPIEKNWVEEEVYRAFSVRSQSVEHDTRTVQHLIRIFKRAGIKGAWEVHHLEQRATWSADPPMIVQITTGPDQWKWSKRRSQWVGQAGSAIVVQLQYMSAVRTTGRSRWHLFVPSKDWHLWRSKDSFLTTYPEICTKMQRQEEEGDRHSSVIELSFSNHKFFAFIRRYIAWHQAKQK